MRDGKVVIAVAIQVRRHRETRRRITQVQHIRRVERERPLIQADSDGRRPGDRHNQILIAIAVEVRNGRKREVCRGEQGAFV